jgi:uncharacterized membrane protein (UPF0127 family)
MDKNKKIILLCCVVVLVGIAISFSRGRDPLFERPYVTIGENRIFVDIAKTDGERERGLSGRASLRDDEGMFFIFPEKGRYGFWMKDMNFPIDIIWMNDHKIVWIEKNVDPQIGVSEEKLSIYIPDEDADSVLEIKGGKSDELNFFIGDVVILTQ